MRAPVLAVDALEWISAVHLRPVLFGNAVCASTSSSASSINAASIVHNALLTGP